MKTPEAVRTYTVEGETRPGVAQEDDLDKIQEYMAKAGIDSPAVILIGEGAISCTAQVEATDPALAISEFAAATPWLLWSWVNVYEGVPE